MDKDLVVQALLGLVGTLGGFIFAAQKKTNKKVEDISIKIPVIIEKQLELKEAVSEINRGVKMVNTEINQIEKSILEMRERNHANNNEVQKLLILTGKDHSGTIKNIEEKLNDLKQTMKEHLAKAALIDIEVAKLKGEAERLGKVTVK